MVMKCAGVRHPQTRKSEWTKLKKKWKPNPLWPSQTLWSSANPNCCSLLLLTRGPQQSWDCPGHTFAILKPDAWEMLFQFNTPGRCDDWRAISWHPQAVLQQADRWNSVVEAGTSDNASLGQSSLLLLFTHHCSPSSSTSRVGYRYHPVSKADAGSSYHHWRYQLNSPWNFWLLLSVSTG